MQTVLFRVFREGNRKVLVGRDGWLFHRPGVQALTGRGPVLGPTHSVAKDPALKQWEGPIPVIRRLRRAAQRAGDSPRARPGAGQGSHAGSSSARRLPRVRALPGCATRIGSDWWPALGEHVQVIDLADPLPYLPDDTHWEAAGRAICSGRRRRLAAAGGHRPFPSQRQPTDFAARAIWSIRWVWLNKRPRRSRRTVQAPSAPPVESDPSAPIVLLGDSNVNMYDDPSLPFYQRGAGFGSWLSACLNEPSARHRDQWRRRHPGAPAVRRSAR